jgi:hypothetical protein
LFRRETVNAENGTVADLADFFEIAAAEPPISEINQNDAALGMRTSPNFGDKARYWFRTPEEKLVERWERPESLKSASGKVGKARLWRFSLAGLDDPLRHEAARGLCVDPGFGCARKT